MMTDTVVTELLHDKHSELLHDRHQRLLDPGLTELNE